MKNYSQRLPVDRDGGNMPDSLPPFPAIAVNMRENASTSSAWGLNANTTAVQVTTGGATVGIKWGTTQATSVFASIAGQSWDATVPANTTKLFVVPRNSAALPNYNNEGTPSIVGYNTSEGLFNVIATRTSGNVAGSVLLTEY